MTAAISLQRVASCLGVHGTFSARTDLFPFAADAPTDSLRKVLERMAKDCLPYIEQHRLLDLRASASITDLVVDPGGYLHTIVLDVELVNLTDETVQVFEHQVLLTDAGGAVHMSDALYGDKKPLAGKSNFIPAGGKQVGSAQYAWAAGPFDVVIALWAQAGPALQQIVRRVPILRGGFPPPPVIQVPAPVYIGPWGRPAEVVTVWHVDHEATWLSVAGDVVNLSRSDIVVDSWSLRIYSDGVVLLEQDLLQQPGGPHFYRTPDGAQILPDGQGELRLPPLSPGGNPTRFVHGFELMGLPSNPAKTTLRLVLDYGRLIGSGWQKGRAVCVMPLARVAPVTLAAPVKAPSTGTWRWGNAPDKEGWDAHAWAGERYCYDLGVVDGSGKTYAGDCATNPDGTHLGACTDNHSFFDYGLPVYAAARGDVELAIDTVDENFGMNKNTSPSAKGNNWVVLQHDHDTVSGYFHLRKGQNRVQPGEPDVAAGTQLGEVGNAGDSSEPHLHFGCVRLHATGRGVNAPVAFSNLKTSGGQAVSVVPGLGLYRS